MTNQLSISVLRLAVIIFFSLPRSRYLAESPHTEHAARQSALTAGCGCDADAMRLCEYLLILWTFGEYSVHA